MPWNLILNLGVKLMGAYFNNRKEKQEERKKFLEFVTYLDSRELISAKVKMSYDDTMSELDKKIAESNKNENT
jgi:hypothetical protein